MNNQSKYKPGGFTFKRFFVGHDKSPMKITTDSVLLGAWAPIDPVPEKVLDIGTGCGVIALMLAQRLAKFKHCSVEAIDIDSAAVAQCRDNITQSPFSNIRVTMQDVKAALSANVIENQYELIVCNPPYFNAAVACRNQQRQTARYTEQLSHKQLFQCVGKLLTEEGQFCVVLPYELAQPFVQLGMQCGLHLAKRLAIQYTQDKPYSLVLLCFSRQRTECDEKVLCMRHQDKSYTEHFSSLLKDFYLRF